MERRLGALGRPTAVDDGKKAGVSISTQLGGMALGERCDVAFQRFARWHWGTEAKVYTITLSVAEPQWTARILTLAKAKAALGYQVGKCGRRGLLKSLAMLLGINRKVFGLSGF
ncbi:CDF family Co(II)/Ni(II) efflux transporter DmeF [Babesia caballi]|uniref:CDF family Co(II)/Ni(II) efflux transporter DmeF n=1 Tax=Babesia caballi TaxID=5871 RepID=A0AAV4LRW7_BABCB|nr:CDF family Co(II)/Ni(II) efflux transporter DmeF [Babesia caballi]